MRLTGNRVIMSVISFNRNCNLDTIHLVNRSVSSLAWSGRQQSDTTCLSPHLAWDVIEFEFVIKIQYIRFKAILILNETVIRASVYYFIWLQWRVDLGHRDQLVYYYAHMLLWNFQWLVARLNCWPINWHLTGCVISCEDKWSFWVYVRMFGLLVLLFGWLGILSVSWLAGWSVGKLDGWLPGGYMNLRGGNAGRVQQSGGVNLRRDTIFLLNVLNGIMNMQRTALHCLCSQVSVHYH